MNTILTNAAGTGRRTSQEQQIGSNINDRMNGNNSVLSNLFAANNEATAAGNAQAQQNQNGSMFGQGAASRNAAAVQQQGNQNVSKNLLNEAQTQAQDQQNATQQAEGWNQQMTNKDQQAYNNAYNAARDTGDTVTQSGLGQIALGNAGDTVTNYGQQQLTKQANEQAANTAAENSYEDQIRKLQLQQLQNSVNASSGDPLGDFLSNAGQVVKLGGSIGNLLAL